MPGNSAEYFIVTFCMGKDQIYTPRSKAVRVRMVARDSQPTCPAVETVDTAEELGLKKAAAGQLTGEARQESSTREEEDHRNMRRRHRNRSSNRRRVVHKLQWCHSPVASRGSSSIIISSRVEQDSTRGQPACLHTTILARETTRRCPTKEDTPTKAGTRSKEDTGTEGNDN